MMKIYMSGHHGSGKSSLARYVSNKYKIPMITETARMILSEQELKFDTLRADIDVANKYQMDVFNRQLEEENKQIASFVSDRSLIDVLSYSAQHTTILPKLINSIELKNYIEKLKNDNSVIFFVRPTKSTLKQDGVRETISWDGVITIDAQIKLLLQMYNLRYFQINTESMQERIQIIDNIINSIDFDKKMPGPSY